MERDLDLPLKGQPLTVRLLAYHMSKEREDKDPFWEVVARILQSQDEYLKAVFYLIGQELKRRKEARKGPWFR